MIRKYWSRSEERQLMTLYPDTPMPQMIAVFDRTDRQIYAKANAMGLRRSHEYLTGPNSGRLSGKDTRGKSSRFKPGHKSWNTGLKGWQAGGDSVRTQFKPGRKPHTWRPIGYERVTKDGYLERKLTDTGVTRHDFVAVHRIVWERHHGPIPPGHVAVFRDSAPKHTNITVERLELISRAELASRKVARAKRTLQEKQREKSN